MESSNKVANLYKELLARGHVELQIDSSFYADNRERLLKRFKQAYPDKKGVIVVASKHTLYLHDTDVRTRIDQAFNFTYLFGSDESDIIGVINIADGRTAILYQGIPDSLEEVYKDKDFYLNLFKCDIATTIDDFPKLMNDDFKAQTIYFFHGVDSDSGAVPEIPKLPDIEKFQTDQEVLYPILCEARVFKSDKEIEIMRFASRVSSEGHIAVMQNIKPGLHEYQAEAVFRLQCHVLAGGKDMAYEGICASGRGNSTLHYMDNDKLTKDGDLMLMDMGCKLYGYASDITTTFPVNGKFSKKQKEIYDAVLDANLSVQRAMKPGVKWDDMHILAEKVILTHLIKLGLVKDTPIEELIENRIGAIFMPHGLGHFLGIRVHDVGGYLKSHPERIQKPGLRSLRTRRSLDKGMAITVEPGCYFIDFTLEQAYKDENKSKYLNKDKLKEYHDVGGVRIEDDVIITENGSENLTFVPRTTEEIEKCMAGQEWKASDTKTELPKSILTRGLVNSSEDKGVPKGLHSSNRKKFLDKLFSRYPELEDENSVVLFKGSLNGAVHESDTDIFPHQEAAFLSLFGAQQGDLHGIIELKTKKAILIPPNVDPAYAIWLTIPDAQYYKNNYEVDDVIFSQDLEQYLEKLHPTTIYVPAGQNIVHGKDADVASFDWLSKYKVDRKRIYPFLIEARWHKSESEIGLIRTANNISSQAQINILQSVKPDIKEYQIEALFRFEVQSRIGSRFLTALPVVSSGDHLGQTSYFSNDETINDGSLVLMDMGAKCYGYCSDITTTFPINGKFNKHQREIYDILVEVFLETKKRLKPEAIVSDVDQSASKMLMGRLEKLGIITPGNGIYVKSLLSPHICLFLSGLSETESGYETETSKNLQAADPESTALTYLWPKLKKGMVVTIAVGLYFDKHQVGAVLQDKDAKAYFNEKKLKEYVDNVGGARIERQFIIGDSKAEDLANMPLTADEIEACMKGTGWNSSTTN